MNEDDNILAQDSHANKENGLAKTMDYWGTHFNGNFVPRNESWDTSSIEFLYNPANSPEPFTYTVIDLINEAFEVWNSVQFSAIEFAEMGYGDTTTETDGSSDNVIYWDWIADSAFAQESGNTGIRKKDNSDINFRQKFTIPFFLYL